LAIGFQRTLEMMCAARDLLAAIVNYRLTPTVDRPPCVTPSRRVPGIFSADEAADFSENGETPVVGTYGIAAPYRLTASIRQGQIDTSPMSAADMQREQEATAAIARENALAD
jgi:hypothetical protein